MTTSRLMTLVAQLVAEDRIGEAEGQALIACAEVGYEGAPDDVSYVARGLIEHRYSSQSAYDAARGLDFSGQNYMEDLPPLYAQQFPDFGELPFAAPVGWTDVSSAEENNGPSFTCGAFTLEFGHEGDVNGDPEVICTIAKTDDLRRGIAAVLLVTNDVVAAQAMALLISLREEVADWQAALGGEREGLDELCTQVDRLIEGEEA